MTWLLRGLARLCILLFAAAGLMVIGLFAASNPQMATLALWPLPFTLDAPLYLAAFAPFLTGALIGGLVVWGRTMTAADARDAARAEARALEKENAALVEQLAGFRAADVDRDQTNRPALLPSAVSARPPHRV